MVSNLVLDVLCETKGDPVNNVVEVPKNNFVVKRDCTPFNSPGTAHIYKTLPKWMDHLQHVGFNSKPPAVYLGNFAGKVVPGDQPVLGGKDVVCFLTKHPVYILLLYDPLVIPGLEFRKRAHKAILAPGGLR